MLFVVITLKQVIVMLCIAVITIIIYKRHLIEAASSKSFSNLLLMVVNPALVFMSFQKEYTSERLQGLFLTFILAMLSFVLMIGISYIFIHKKGSRNVGMERFGCIYSNCAFIGIPIVQAVIGMEGVFYLSAYMIAFNLFVWTHGLIQITGTKDMSQLKIFLKSPVLAAILLGLASFLLRIPLPETASDVLSMIADMNTPLAMIVAGMAIADADILTMFRKKRIYLVSFVKLLFLPILFILLLSLFKVPEVVKTTIVIASACPAATTGTMFAIKYDKDFMYMAEIFSVTTILSIITIPIVIYLSQIL